jgi:hypothetical protein
MQGGHQLPRLDQKRIDEVRRLREAMASGRPIPTDKEKAEEYAGIMGMDGELLMDRLLAKIEKQAKGQHVASM